MIPASGLQIGQYQVVGEIGRGGMARVYRAYQPSLERQVAIKVLETEADPHFGERFRAEARVVASLRHPNIVQIYDLGEQDGLLYIVMELIEGVSLRQRLSSPWPPMQAAPIIGQLAAALDFAHSRGIVHRDVKPGNVLLEGDRSLLVDFGIARILNAASRMTRVNATLGTPDYMSPEQASAEEVGPASDVYSLGVVAYELLTGRVPFSADTPLGLLSAHVHKPVPRATALNPRLNEALADVLERVLAKQPQERYPTAAAFAQALDRVARRDDDRTRETPAFSETMATGLYLAERPGKDSETVQSLAPSVPVTPSDAPPGPKRRLGMVAAALAVAVALVAGGTLAYLRPSGLGALQSAQQAASVSPVTERAPEPTALSNPTLVATVAPQAIEEASATPAPSVAAPSPSLPPSSLAASVPPAATPAPSAASVWSATEPALDAVWGKDWLSAIGAIDGFLGQFPDFAPAKEKQYVALMGYAAELAAKHDLTGASAQLARARALLPERPEAAAALAALADAAPVAAATAAPAPAGPPTAAQPAVRPAAPAAVSKPASQPRAGFTPTF